MSTDVAFLAGFMLGCMVELGLLLLIFWRAPEISEDNR